MDETNGLWVFLPRTFYVTAGAELFPAEAELDALEAEYCRLGWAMFWAQVALAFLVQHHSELHSAETDW